MSELKLCPFCGGEAHTYKNNLWHVACERAHNGCVTMSAFITEAEAIAAWNTRADYHGYEQAAIEAWESIKEWNTRTPEQAIAATLGSERHAYEQRITGDGSDWGEIMTDAFDSLMSSASESCTPDEMRALESHISATLGGGECDMVIVSNTQDVRKCSACGKLTRFDYPLDRDQLNYCPKCGAMVRKAVDE